MSEDLVNKVIVVFDANGNGECSVDWPWPDAQTTMLDDLGKNYAILDKNPPNAYWMDLSVINKPTYLRMGISTIRSTKTKAIADGVDTATISNLPISCILMINGVPVPVEGGSYIIASDEPQTINVTTGGAYVSNTITVEFVDLAQLRADKWEEIKLERENKLSFAVTSFGSFDTNAEGKSNIAGIATDILGLRARSEPVPDIEFRMYDNSTQTFTPDEFMQASSEVTTYIKGIYTHSWYIEAYMATLTTIEDISAINWDTELV